jgi:hypothetical protein
VLRLLVCGSRDWTDKDVIADEMANYVPDCPTVIHGAAKGADSLAAEVAAAYGLDVQAFPADWARHGKRAGILRNLAMLDEKPYAVLAFQRNGSRGTQHTIDEALKRGIPVRVVSAVPAT